MLVCYRPLAALLRNVLDPTPHLILILRISYRTPYLQPAAAEARQDEEIKGYQPKTHQRKRRRVALEELFQIYPLDVVLRLLRDF